MSCLFCVSTAISFSMMFRRVLNMGPRGPSAVNIPRMFSMSVLLNVLVSMAVIR